MLVVKIELWPHGDELAAETIGVAVIYNDGTGVKTKGNYKFAIKAGNRKWPWKQGELKGFPRTRQNAWHLLYRCLKKVLEK